jgi:Holliday junction resolvase RusA-like endonuclease
MIQFTVYGTPVGKGRPKFSTFNGHATAYTPAKTVNYENLVKLSYQQQCGGKMYEKDVPLAIDIMAHFPIPKSVSKKKADMMRAGTIRPTKKPDLDNCIKSICDALNGIAYYDDAQIVEVTMWKFYSDEPKAEITIRAVKEFSEI